MKLKFDYVFLLALFLLSSCKEDKLSRSKYIGFWAETQFVYIFKSNNEFIFSTEGHFGNTKSYGKYSIIDSIVLLHSYTDWGLFHGVLKNRLIIKKELECLQDFDNNYYCLDTQVLNFVIEKESDLMEKIKEILLDQEEVRKIISKFSDHSKPINIHSLFAYEGIVLIDNNQYHSFQLRKINDDPNIYRYFTNIQNQYYLVNLKENLIYKHHTRGDSISIMGSLF